MPYVDQHRRESLEPDVRPESAGELNFAITSMCAEYIARMGLRYDNINEVVGALECAKLEMYRRVAAPYEDTKIVANGDVYPETILTEV